MINISDSYFELPNNNNSIIKVIGVGGGGCNAVSYMYEQGITDVDFIICNTDLQHLKARAVPSKVQIGITLKEGLGAGGDPEMGKQAAIENIDDLLDIIGSKTKMAFITAGMGGGTGTGASPIIAKTLKEKGILTIAIVTIPFRNEGELRMKQAMKGIEELKDNCDSLIIINNEKLVEIYGKLKILEAFSKSDEILCIAAKSIAEIITVPGIINVDFSDIKAIMENSGVALIGSASEEGEDRLIRAFHQAINSPLLNNNNIGTAKNILVKISFGEDEIYMEEKDAMMKELQRMIKHKGGHIKEGITQDKSLGDKVNVTIVATGFETKNFPEISINEESEEKIEVHTLSENKGDRSQTEFTVEGKNKKKFINIDGKFYPQTKIDFEKIRIKEKNIDFQNKTEDRIKILKDFANNKNANIEQYESIPAYKRKGIDVSSFSNTDDKDLNISKYSITELDSSNIILNSNNSYLYDNVD